MKWSSGESGATGDNNDLQPVFSALIKKKKKKRKKEKSKFNCLQRILKDIEHNQSRLLCQVQFEIMQLRLNILVGNIVIFQRQ